jgi:hypothetical protein
MQQKTIFETYSITLHLWFGMFQQIYLESIGKDHTIDFAKKIHILVPHYSCHWNLLVWQKVSNTKFLKKKLGLFDPMCKLLLTLQV